MIHVLSAWGLDNVAMYWTFDERIGGPVTRYPSVTFLPEVLVFRVQL